jgi:hypothetical protein
MNLKKKNLLSFLLLLAIYSSKDYLQKQRREREQANQKKKKTKPI